ncbi:MAG: LPS-assembly protein LptD [Fimbriimonadaceae bacterium]|nr:LPS-assembly protein LptD [Fimbriimonadaceae bacterium]
MAWLIGTPAPVLSPLSVAPAFVIQSEQIDQVLRIEWRHKSADLEAKTLTFTGGVKAYYGPTVLTAEKLTLYMKDGEERGVAEGDVRIDDPDGMILAQRFEFNWALGTGNAQDVEVHVDRLVVKAESIDVMPDAWTLKNIVAMPCPDEPGRITISGDSAVVRPGKSGVVRRIALNVFGKKVLSLPKHTFSLDSRSQGISMPSLSVRPGTGVGVTWSSDIPVAADTFVSGSFSSFTGRRPRTDFMLSQDLLKGGSERSVRPGSELGDPFSDSYLDNVLVKSPESEHKRLSARVFTAGIGSAWNLSSGGSLGGGGISKPWDIAVEMGGTVGPLATTAQIRYQRIGENGGGYRNRAVVSSTVGIPAYSVNSQLSTLARFDARMYLGNEKFGWMRGTAGLLWKPAKELQIAVGRTFTVDTGTPSFSFDDLDRKHTWITRADLELGPRKLSVIGKYDSERSTLYDREVFLSQVAGCFELYLLYRQEPRRFGIGFQFRAFDVFERLKSRDIQRKEKTPKAPHLTVIGG